MHFIQKSKRTGERAKFEDKQEQISSNIKIFV